MPSRRCGTASDPRRPRLPPRTRIRARVVVLAGRAQRPSIACRRRGEGCHDPARRRRVGRAHGRLPARARAARPTAAAPRRADPLALGSLVRRCCARGADRRTPDDGGRARTRGGPRLERRRAGCARPERRRATVLRRHDPGRASRPLGPADRGAHDRLRRRGARAAARRGDLQRATRRRRSRGRLLRDPRRRGRAPVPGRLPVRATARSRAALHGARSGALTDAIAAFGATTAIQGHADELLDAAALSLELGRLRSAADRVERLGDAALATAGDDGDRELLALFLAGR